MSDKMTPIPFPGLMEWMLNEHSSQGTVFGIHRPFVADKEKAYEIFGRKLETPFGPAAALTPSWPKISWRPITRGAGSLS